MRAYTLTHLTDDVLLCGLKDLVARDCATTAELLAHIAEVDDRRLFAPAGCRSMHDYCVRELGLSEDAASKRIQVARKARECPRLFAAIADGSLHLTGARLLVPHLTVETVNALLPAAAHKSKTEIELMLARMFPSSELIAWVQPLGPAPLTTPGHPHAPGHVPEASRGSISELNGHSPARLKPVASERFALQVTIGQTTHEKLEHARALLSHAIPSGDVAQVLDRALDSLIREIEKRKYGASSKPRTGAKSATRERHVPAHVRHAVWERDRGQCTFTSDEGRRCGSKRFLELDHIVPVANGGEATVDNLTLKCRTHNQLAAERAFGTTFMEGKRNEAQAARTAARQEAATQVEVHAAVADDEIARIARQQANDVLAGLRELGFRAVQAKRAAEFSATLPVTTLEERMRGALRYLHPKSPANAA